MTHRIGLAHQFMKDTNKAVIAIKVDGKEVSAVEVDISDAVASVGGNVKVYAYPPLPNYKGELYAVIAEFSVPELLQSLKQGHRTEGR